MGEDLYELTTDDLIIDEPKLPPARSASVGISVRGAAPKDPAPAPAPKPRFVPTALSRPIKERTRTPSQAKEQQPLLRPTSFSAKAASFYEQAIEAEREGDVAAAIRHVKLAITFDPGQERYHALLQKLSAR